METYERISLAARGMLSPNETRQGLGLPPLAGGDVMGIAAPSPRVPRAVPSAKQLADAVWEQRRIAADAPRKAEIDPDIDGWFHGTLVFYSALAFCVFIVGIGFLFFFLLSRLG